jgi:hypothetical protein
MHSPLDSSALTLSPKPWAPHIVIVYVSVLSSPLVTFSSPVPSPRAASSQSQSPSSICCALPGGSQLDGEAKRTESLSTSLFSAPSC